MLEPKWLRRGGLGAGRVLHCVLSTVTNLNIRCAQIRQTFGAQNFDKHSVREIETNIARFNFMLKTIKQVARSKLSDWDPKTNRKPNILTRLTLRFAYCY